MNLKIKLGQLVRCRISGFSGIATQLSEQLNGNVGFGVQPQAKEPGTYPDCMILDHHTLEVIDAVAMTDSVTPHKETKIRVGNIVRDLVSCLEGTAVDKVIYLNGCTSFGVIPKCRDADWMNTMPERHYIGAERLAFVSEGLALKTEEPTGGPAVRVKAHVAVRG